MSILSRYMISMPDKVILLSTILLVSVGVLFGQNAEEVNLTNHPADDRYASYSPDGSRIVFETNRNGNWDIFLMNASGGHQESLTKSNADDRSPSWHPDGKSVVFISNRDGKFELFEIGISNKKVRKLNIPFSDAEVGFPRYSPDGTMLAFSIKNSDDNADIYIADSKGRKIRPLTSFGMRTYYPAWSPDGQTIAFFSRHETGNSDDEIYTMTVDGLTKYRLTNWPDHNFCPMWSHDGRYISYVTSAPNGRPEIYIMDVDGENQTRLTYNDDGDTLPAWSPDDQKLIFSGYRNGNYEICVLTPAQINR